MSSRQRLRCPDLPVALSATWPYTGRTRVIRIATSAEIRRRSKRLELRTTPEERELIERAAEVSGSGLTEFVLTHASDAARRILADRDRFHLSGDALAAWEAVNARRARDLPGLRDLMSRPSPFAE